jgi:hypothetical protein
MLHKGVKSSDDLAAEAKLFETFQSRNNSKVRTLNDVESQNSARVVITSKLKNKNGVV